MTQTEPSTPLQSTEPESRRKRLARWLRFGLRSKITLPYVILSVLLSLAGGYVVTRLIVDTIQERFANQLIESGRLVADGMVKVEQETLATVRAIALTNSVGDALADRDADALHRLVLPIAVNNCAEYVELVDTSGVAVLSLHHRRGSTLEDYEASYGGDVYGEWEIVQQVLAGEEDTLGDKFAGRIVTPWGDAFYISGPVKQQGEIVGAVVVGESLESLATRLQQESIGHVTFFDSNGQVLVSTLYAAGEDQPIAASFWQQVIDEQEVSVYPRNIVSRGREYSEVFGPLESRGRTDLAVFSAGLERSFAVRATPVTQLQMVIGICLALLIVVFVGTLVARRITRPLLEVVEASRAVATGDLEQQVEVRTNDEVGVLAQSFNEMVEGLRRGQFIRETFGRAVSPEVVEELMAGGLELGGETRQVTVLLSDIRGFTTLSEKLPAETVVKWLNEYLGTVTAAIGAHGGVVNKFIGDAVLAIFGAPQNQPDSALRSVKAAFEMRRRLAELNRARRLRGEVELRNGIGLSSGRMVAGIIGSQERWEYTVIGDAVNVAARIESLNKEYPDYAALATAETVTELGDTSWLELDDLGDIQVKGRVKAVRVYGLKEKR